MTLPFISEFKLGGSHGDGVHPYLNEEGAFLGNGLPLLEKNFRGRWQPRSRSLLERALSTHYGVPVNLDWRMDKLASVADALTKGDLSLAAIALVHTQLPPSPKRDDVQSVAHVGDLTKYDADEPRVPAGSPEGGEWTNWLSLPDGERIDELGDLLEWIANAKPEDESTIRQEIKRVYYAVGDTRGGDALNRALSDVLQGGGDLRDRRAVLEDYEAYTREDPAEAAQFGRDLVSGALLAPLDLFVPEDIPADVSVWELAATKRGRVIEQRLGMNLHPNYPTIDVFEDGIATSIKSIDLKAATYQSTSGLARRLNRDVNSLANFEGAEGPEVEIKPEQITDRVLKVAIPKDTITRAQRKAADMARARAEAMGVNLMIIPFE